MTRKGGSKGVVGPPLGNPSKTPYTPPKPTLKSPAAPQLPAQPPTPVGPTIAQQSAYEAFAAILAGYGLDIGKGLEEVIRKAVIDGIGPDRIDLLMPEIEKTDAWKTRFPGWAERRTNGFNQITVGQYLDLENQYHRIMQENGLPAGFYDDPSDFGNWIGKNVSPDEIRDRVNIATGEMRKVDPTARNMLSKFYGVTSGDLTAYFLDQKRAMPTLDRQYKAANIAGWAARNGLDTSTASRYENLVDKGVSIDQAAQGYATVASLNKTVGAIASVYGENYDQTAAENDVFFGQSDARRRIVANEQASFGGSSRGATGSANRGTSY